MANLRVKDGFLKELFLFCLAAESRGLFLEFYVYSSVYKGVKCSRNPKNRGFKHLLEKGVGISLVNSEWQEFYSFCNSFSLCEIEKKLHFLRRDIQFNCKKMIPLKQMVFGESLGGLLKSKIRKFWKYPPTKTPCFLSVEFEQICIVNSRGCVVDRRVSQNLLVVGDGGGKSRFSTSDNVFIGDFVDFDVCALKRNVVYCDYPFEFVVLAPKAAGMLIHEVCHMLESDFFVPGNPFWGKNGALVSCEKLTVHDDPSLFYGFAPHVDDEGLVLEKGCLIEKGRLRGVLGCRQTKSAMSEFHVLNRARRESHRFIPTGRSYCSVVEPGAKSAGSAIECIASEGGSFVVLNDLKASSLNSKTFEICCSADVLYYNGCSDSLDQKVLSLEIKGDSFLSSIIDVFDDPEYYESVCYSSSGHLLTATYVPSVLLSMPSSGVLYNCEESGKHITIRF